MLRNLALIQLIPMILYFEPVSANAQQVGLRPLDLIKDAIP